MSDRLVRVKHADTGHEYTVIQSVADADKKLTIIDAKSATDENGRPSFPKPHATVREVVNTVHPTEPAAAEVAVSEPARTKRATIKES